MNLRQLLNLKEKIMWLQMRSEAVNAVNTSTEQLHIHMMFELINFAFQGVDVNMSYAEEITRSRYNPCFA